jgi:hypothetical protein
MDVVELELVPRPGQLLVVNQAIEEGERGPIDHVGL